MDKAKLTGVHIWVINPFLKWKEVTGIKVRLLLRGKRGMWSDGAQEGVSGGHGNVPLLSRWWLQRGSPYNNSLRPQFCLAFYILYFILQQKDCLKKIETKGRRESLCFYPGPLTCLCWETEIMNRVYSRYRAQPEQGKKVEIKRVANSGNSGYSCLAVQRLYAENMGENKN